MFYINNVLIEQNHFPDGTLNLKLNTKSDFLTDMSVFTFGNYNYITWYYENDAELFTLLNIVEHYKNEKLILTMPYCPHARMDRIEKQDDVFTLKTFANIINSCGFKEVIIRDPHSNVAPALINNCKVQSVNIYISEVVKDLVENNFIDSAESLVICFPDEGAEKRYSNKITTNNIIVGHKNRDWQTGKVLDLKLYGADIFEKNVLIIDDICSYGNTFYYTAKALKELGAKKVFLYVTHCENNIFKGKINENPDLIDKIYTTESIFKPDPAFDLNEKIAIKSLSALKK